MADQVLDFLNRPVEEKKAPPEDPVLSFLNRPIPGAESPAPESQAPAWVAKPPITLDQVGKAIGEAGSTGYEAFAPESPVAPVAVASPAEPAGLPPVAATPAPTEPPADLSGQVQPEFTPHPALPVASLAEIAAGQGTGGGGGSGWGTEDKAAVQPIAPPERTGVLGVVDKGTELAAKGLAEAAAPAAEAVGAVHGFTPELNKEDQEKVKTDVGNALLTFGRGWIKGRTFGLYQPPELTEDQKKVGGEWSQTVGDLIGMGGAIKSVASSVGGVFQGLDIAPTGIKGVGNLIKIVGEAGVTGLFYDLLNRVGTIAGSDAAGKPIPEFGGGMIAQGLEYGAAQLGQPEVAKAIHEGAAKLGPAGMALDFMTFALGGTVAARLLGATIERIESVRTQARAQNMATSDFNWKTDNVDEAISVLQQAQDRTARTVGKGSIPPEEASAIEAARNQAIEKNPAFRNAALYMRMGDEFKDADGNLLPADQIETKLAQGQARVDAEKQAASVRQAAGTKEPAAAKETPVAPAGQPMFASEGEGDIAPTSTKVLTDLRAKATATPDDAWVMRGKATDIPGDPEALQLMQKNLVEVRQDEQGNVWMRAAGEYPEAAPKVSTTKPQTTDAPMGNTGSMVTEAGSVSPKATPETQGGKRLSGETQPAPEVYQEESGWWKVKGTDNKFSTQVAAQKAADIIQQNRPPTLAEAATPTQPMGSTGTTTTEAGAPKSAEPAASVDWQSNPSVQHFQAQGFEFVEAKTPEETANLQTQGFEKAGVAPDLWFKRPAPVETPATTIAQPENVQQAASGEGGGENQAPVESQAQPPAKEPWEMMQSDFIGQGKANLKEPFLSEGQPFGTEKQFEQKAAIIHRGQIEQALASGKPVPPEVLADYPDLAPKAPTPLPSAFTGTPPQTRDKKITDHEDITGQTKINAVTYSKFADIVKAQDWPKVQEELTLSSANFTVGAFDHHFNPLSVMGRLEDGGLTHQEAKALVKNYEAQAFKPVREALAARRAAEDVQVPVESGGAKEPWMMSREEFRKHNIVQPYLKVDGPKNNYLFTEDTKDNIDNILQGKSGHPANKVYFQQGGLHHNAHNKAVLVLDKNKIPDGLLSSHDERSGRQGEFLIDASQIPSESIIGSYPHGYTLHEDLVKQALAAGKPVPPEVLADYPDLVSAAATEYWPAKAEPRIKPLGPGRVEVSYYDGTEVQHHIVATIEEATALKDKVWTPAQAAPVVVPPKPLSSAITGKKTGPVVGAKPVTPRGAGLHPGIVGKPKITPAPDLAQIANSGTAWDNASVKQKKEWTTKSGWVPESKSNLQWKHLTEDAQKALSNIIPTQQPAAPTFKAGDRVSFRNAGKDLTGTLDNAPDKDGLVDINVDVAGVKGRPPIGQVLMGFKAENLTMTEAAPAEAIDKSGKEPIISTTEATQAQPQGGKADADVTNRPGKTPENVQGSSGVKGSENVPPVGDGGKTGAVPEGPGRRDDGVVQPGGGSGPGGPGSVEEVQGGRGPGKDEGNKPGAPPVHGGSPGNVAGVQRPSDYRITPGELKRPGGWKATAAQNLDIIELAKKLEAEGRWATPEEQALLVQYTGFGAGEIRNNIFPRNAYSRKSGKIDLYRVSDEWRPLAEKLMEITTPEELAEIAQSTQYAHYTSESVIRSIYKAVERMGFPGGKILEPGAGNGLFGVLIPDSMRGVSKYTGIERDSVTALVAKHLLPNQHVMRADFIKQQLPDNFFDLGIGNPPFASTTILADPRYAKLRFSLHDFFFAKTIDKIHPGGLMVFITSRFTMDKAGDKARQYLADRADLIGAIRLPQTAFKANAGTEVVTDVLFLRKRAEGDAPGGLPWMEQGEVPLTYEERQYQRDPDTYRQVEKMVTQTKNVLINEYFVAHPEMILGTNSLEGSMYGENDYTVKPLDGNIEDHFAKAVENLPENVYSIVKRSPVEQEKIVIERDFNPLVKKEGNVYVDAKGNLMVVEQGVGVSVDDVPALKTLSVSDKVWVRDYVPLRDALKKAAHDQRVDDPGWEASQKALIKVYDAFVKKHGQILEYTTFELAVKENGVQVVNNEGEPVVREYRRFKNARRMRADVESVLVYALEKITEQGEIIKDAALTRRFMQPPVRIEPKTPFEALAVTLDEVGKLDLDLIASKLNLPRAEVIEALGDMIYKAPGATWQTTDEYLSGDVKTKLEEAQAAAKADSQYQRNAEALQLVQPTPLTPAQVSVGLGASWIEPRYIMQFAHEIMDVEVPITFNAQINDWGVNTGRSARQRTTEWGTEDRSAAEILSHVLNNKNLVIKRTEADAFGVKHTFTDDAATTRVNEIAKRMKEAFATWVWSEKQRADDFLAFYDRKYNNLADRKFDGSHLSLPGLSITYPLHDHQKRAVWRAVVTGNTLLNHAVGSGKTLEQICIGQEMKRLGLIKRVLHVVPNHMLEQFSSDFMEAYPMANIMVADEQKFHMDNRKRFMAQASLNDPDATIITHSALGKLPMKPENVKAVRDIFIRDLEDLLASLEEDPQANRILIAKVQRRIENMEQRFDSMTNASTDQAVFFEDFVGSSAILILDESHEFRKLDFVTNRQAKGIDSNGSRKALDLYVKIKWLASQNEGRSHIFATGTPIVNTMGELYTLMRFFDDKGQMEADGIHFFDAWANMFGDMVSDWEKTGAGNWEEVSRFASFVNIPELMKRVKHFTDVLTPAQLGGYVNLPKIEGGQATLMLAPESKAVKDYQVQVLQPRLVRSRRWKPSPTEKGNPDPVINIITDGRLASIDMRYHYPNLPSDPTSKLNLMIDDIIEIHHRTADYPYFDKTTGKEEPIRGAGQIVFYKLGFGKQITLNRKFDARAWVMKRFKEAGIPSSQVAWIDDYKTSTAKGQMSKEVRSGAKRILIGSMAKMGTGLNVQPRMYVSHLLDPPWFPADLEQAEGRTVRQGNQNLQVIIKRWASKGSYDSTMFQMVARKAKVIDQIWSGDDSLRTAQDVSRVSQYQMAAAYSSGDQRAIELAQAHGEVARLRRLRDAHHAEQRELRNKESNLNFWIPRDKVQLTENKAAATAVGGYVRDVTTKIGKQAFTPEDKRADVGMAMMQAINDEIASREGDVASQTTGDSPDIALKRLRIDSKTNKIGDINGFDLLVTTANHGEEVWATVHVQVKTLNLWVQQGGAFPLIDTPAGAGLITRTINVLNKVERDVSHLESKLDEKKAELRRVTKRLGAPFPDEAALIEKEAEVSRLQRELAASGGVVLDEEVGVDIAAGLAAEKTATYRTGPTIATAMRRPLVAGARYRLGGTAGVESKTGRGTRDLPAAFTGKKGTPNAEVRSQAADVAAAQPGNRSDNLPPAGTGTQRDLEDFKLRRRQEWFRPGKKEFAVLEYSETLAASPEFQEIVRDVLAQGIKKVIPVKNAYFDGAIYPEKDGDVMLLNEVLSESATHRQIVKHEGTHHLALLGDPVILSLIKAVDTKSVAFKVYREVLNAGYREAGMPRLSDRAMAEEVVADYRAGLTRVDLNGQEVHLGEAFQGPDSLKHILAAHDFAHPAGGMEQAKASKFAFRMKQPKVPITAKENQGIDKWLGEREITDFDAKVIAGKRQRAIMEALGKKKFDAEAKAIDNAMTHYIELKSFPEHVANYYADLKPEDQKAVDLAQHTIPNNPKLKAIADKIAEGYEVQGDLALDAEVVHELRDNYAAHIWDLDKGPSVEAQRKFATKTGHAQQRTFDTEIQGLAAGYEPLVRGATNKAMIYSQDVGHTIADRQFVVGERGKLFSKKQSDERPTQIQHPNMRDWTYAGNIEVESIITEVKKMSEEIKNSTKTSSTTSGAAAGGAPSSGPVEKMKEVIQNSLIIRGMTEDEANAYINRVETAAVKAAAGVKATPGQAPPETTTTVIKELRETIVKIEKSQEVVGHKIKPVGRKDLFVNAKGDIFQKVPLFASKGAAEKLNNILGTSALKGIPFLSKAIDISIGIKDLMLFMTGYHHQAGVRGWLLGVSGQFGQHGIKALSPRWTYRQGLKLINDMDPVIRHGVKVGGLVLGVTPEWREKLNHERGKVGEMLDKWKVTKTIREKVLGLYDQQVNFLFNKFFAGLQAMGYITRLKAFKKAFPDSTDDNAAQKVAKSQNYNFGNLNLARMGRNPTLQHIFSGFALAPRWTESNYGPLARLVEAFSKGDKEDAWIYRNFWAGAFAKGIAAIILGNLAMSMFDDKSAWESFKERWRAGNLRWLGLNITPAYRGAWKAMGMEPSKSQKVFSPMGHFLDVIKMASHPILFAKHKGSPLVRFVFEAMTGTNWKGQPYTTAGEFAGTTAGGSLKGKIVKEGKGGAIGWPELPSFLMGQIRGSVPIPAGNYLGLALGEIDGFDALTKATGTMVSSFTPKTEAQGIISDYYQAALPNRNLTPEEQDRKSLEKTLLKQARSGDMEGFTEAVTEAVADGKLSRVAAKDLMKEAQHPEGIASFAKLPLEVALNAFEAATDQEKELWGPALIEKVARSQPETLMHNQASLQDIFRGLGMEDFADTLDELKIEDFTPGPLTSSDEYRGLSSLDTGAVDSYLADKMTGQVKKSKGPVKGAPRITHPSKTGPTQKEKLRRLGLG